MIIIKSLMTFWWQLFILFLVGMMVYLIYPSFIGAVYVPTPIKSVRRMLEIAGVGPDDVVYDMGSGDGRIIITAAKEYGAKAVGVEADPLRVLYTKWRIMHEGLHDKVRIIWGNFFKTSMTDATVITVYQGPEINLRLMEKFKKELHLKTRVVSFFFKFESYEPIYIDEKNQIYLYQV